MMQDHIWKITKIKILGCHICEMVQCLPGKVEALGSKHSILFEQTNKLKCDCYFKLN
jgi:hypothetical protein